MGSLSAFRVWVWSRKELRDRISHLTVEKSLWPRKSFFMWTLLWNEKTKNMSTVEAESLPVCCKSKCWQTEAEPLSSQGQRSFEGTQCQHQADFLIMCWLSLVDDHSSRCRNGLRPHVVLLLHSCVRSMKHWGWKQQRGCGLHWSHLFISVALMSYCHSVTVEESKRLILVWSDLQPSISYTHQQGMWRLWNKISNIQLSVLNQMILVVVDLQMCCIVIAAGSSGHSSVLGFGAWTHLHIQ